MSKILYTDLMEYSTDQLAQAAWVTDATGLELDYMEYATDGAAQAAYVTSAGAGEVVDQQQTGTPGEADVGDASNVEYRQAQSFILSGTKTVTAVELYQASISGSPTGNWTIRIETDSSGLPSGNLAHANASKIIAPGSAYTALKVTFDTPFQLNASTTYWIVVLCDNQSTGNSWRIGFATNVYANGFRAESNDGGSSWAATVPAYDLYFKVYVQSAAALQSYSENTIVNQGTYSLKAIAAITDSLNETLTKSGLSLDLSGKSELKIDFYAGRTGTNIQIKIHDSGGTTSTKNITISVANTWETTTWDISGIADVNKDDIDQIIIEIINADSANTFYVDNFRSEEPLQCYSEDTIKVQGNYSLKVVAVQTEALNKTLTKTLTDYLDYSIQDVIKFDVRAARTGANLQLQIHDVGGTTSSHSITIDSANTWQTETWDISGIATADRDTIDKIIIKIINADVVDSTIYFDNLYSQVIVESAHVFIGG